MTPAWLVALPLVGGLVAWAAGRVSRLWPRVVALAVTAAMLSVSVVLWARLDRDQAFGWETRVTWLPQIGSSLHLGADGLSLLMLMLTGLIGVVAVIASWTDVRARVGFYHLNLLWVLAGVAGVFLALDLLVLYLFWELMLIPMFLLIDLWGHEHRHRAAIKFLIFTQAGGLLMLLAIVGLYLAHGEATGLSTFDYQELLATPLATPVALWLMLGLFAAFAVKLPAVPLHTWLPDAHTEAPTAGSIILASLMLKTGGYGLLRFLIPLFPEPAAQFAPVAMALGVIGIIYGAWQAFGQTDAKRLVAYSSVSHLGFVLVGAFAGQPLAVQGAVMQMLAHGLSTGALFLIVGVLQDRVGTRDLRALGGLWAAMPRLGGMALFFALASLGLPGMANFVGEFLVLLGAYRASPALAAAAAVGLVLGAVYALWFVQRVFFGPLVQDRRLWDLRLHELAALSILAIAALGLGLWPMWALGATMPLSGALAALLTGGGAP